ncbi:MAG: hypothetical protein HY867_13670 [Chloroflexi bacterium]|nr:hypothetical protein [Chloroflexota bacterium]
MNRMRKRLLAAGFICLGLTVLCAAFLEPIRRQNASQSGFYIWWVETIVDSSVANEWKSYEDKIEAVRAEWEKARKEAEAKLGKRIDDLSPPDGPYKDISESYRKQLTQLEKECRDDVTQHGVSWSSTGMLYPNHDSLKFGPADLDAPAYPWHMIRTLQPDEGVPDYHTKVALVGYPPDSRIRLPSGTVAGDLGDSLPVPPTGRLSKDTTFAEFRRVVDWKGNPVDLIELRKKHVEDRNAALRTDPNIPPLDVNEVPLKAPYFMEVRSGTLPPPQRINDLLHKEVRLLSPGAALYGDITDCDFSIPRTYWVLPGALFSFSIACFGLGFFTTTRTR